MTSWSPIYITVSPLERALVLKALGDMRAPVLVEGWSTLGLRASSIIVTPDVDVDSEWFQSSVLTRLGPDGVVFTIRGAWNAIKGPSRA